jgi:hypothetical protein
MRPHHFDQLVEYLLARMQMLPTLSVPRVRMIDSIWVQKISRHMMLHPICVTGQLRGHVIGATSDGPTLREFLAIGDTMEALIVTGKLRQIIHPVEAREVKS